MESIEKVLLEELLKDIDEKTFDLEAWKKKAILIIKKIFGDKDEKIGMIENLHYEFSSWSLRDSSGGTSYDKVKATARKIIEASIAELLLKQKENLIMGILNEELTGKEYSSLQTLIDTDGDLLQSLKSYFSKLSSEKKDELLAALVMSSATK